MWNITSNGSLYCYNQLAQRFTKEHIFVWGSVGVIIEFWKEYLICCDLFRLSGSIHVSEWGNCSWLLLFSLKACMLIRVLPGLSQLNGLLILLICTALLFVDLNYAILYIQPSFLTFLQWSLYLSWIWCFSYFYLSTLECFSLVWHGLLSRKFCF